MPVRMRSADEPLPDRRAQHERELAELRLNMAAIVKIVFTALAVVLALGALLVAAGDRISASNSLVRFVWWLCRLVDGVARDRPELVQIRVAHRVGLLRVGDCALYAEVCTPHRPAPFVALAALVDEVKRELPIWKRQLFADGREEWVNCP